MISYEQAIYDLNDLGRDQVYLIIYGLITSNMKWDKNKITLYFGVSEFIIERDKNKTENMATIEFIRLIKEKIA